MSSDQFDYIIIGAGTAGCLLAERLTSDERTTVCVLESGPMDNNPFISIPAGFLKTVYNPKTSWQFETPELEALNGRSMSLPQGRVLGGSSAVNGMVYNRGQRHDYDRWAQMGNRGWAYDDILPYFRNSETRIGPSDDHYRGKNGALSVSDNDWSHVLFDAFIAGAQQIGIPRNADHNAGDQAGVGLYQRTIKNGRRVSSAHAFLRPAMKRRNLDVRTHAQVSSIVLEGKRATSVRYVRSGDNGSPEKTVHARREIILCGGTINSPRLLQLSGIGPGAVLQSAGIHTLHNLPGVGENFRDHCVPRIVARVKGTSTINQYARGLRLGMEIAKWAVGRPSILGLQPAMGHIFWKSDEALDYPDLQVTFTPASYKQGYIGLLDDFPGITCGAYQQRPESRGHVRVTTSSFRDAPVVDPNYLSDPSDQRVALAGVKLVRRLFASPAMAKYIDQEVLPGVDAQSDDELLNFIRNFSFSVYHLIGTSKMGPASDPMAVVDDELRVHGIEGLRVVDASIMPTMPSGNTQAPTYMIAEKAADMIKAAAK